MPTLEENLSALNQAIADGVRSVTVGGQTTIYNTTDSLIRARNDLKDQINAEAARNGAPVPKLNYLYYAGRGY
jgi:hypothetical protein